MVSGWFFLVSGWFLMGGAWFSGGRGRFLLGGGWVAALVATLRHQNGCYNVLRRSLARRLPTICVQSCTCGDCLQLLHVRPLALFYKALVVGSRTCRLPRGAANVLRSIVHVRQLPAIAARVLFQSMGLAYPVPASMSVARWPPKAATSPRHRIPL